MENNEILKFKDESQNMFNEACDPTSLIRINLHKETRDVLITKFLISKVSKTDLAVLVGLMQFWDERLSVITLESFNEFRLVTGLELANANLSRSLTSLQKNGFIEKVGSNPKLEYLFHTPFDILRLEIGK
jgi:hypothetical protein